MSGCISGIKKGLSEIYNQLAKNSKNKKIIHLHAGINKFKRSYQPRT
jgi:hypothetical protein